ncbi:MAG TPA: metallopeptidase family protein [Phycisphaerales bacterium]|nr:metallopeptidase family protein [Phycisphaerales bacterium]
MTDAERERFDALVQDAIDALPPRIRALLDEVPVVVLDEPTKRMIADLTAEGTIEPGADPTELCGLHSGVAITERSVEDPGGWGSPGQDTFAPEQIHLFRRGIIGLATEDRGWKSEHADDDVYEEILVTLLHEIGHHFGLDEDDLEELGYA